MATPASAVANISAAIMAMKYVNSKMDIGASNKPGPGMIARLLCAGGTFSKGELRERVDQDLAAIAKQRSTTSRDVLESSADWAKFYGCGNCGEQSALAFVHLRSQHIHPLDWVQISNFKHAFVIVGWERESDPSDYTTWGGHSAICDPWASHAGPGGMLRVWYPHGTVGLLYREE